VQHNVSSHAAVLDEPVDVCSEWTRDEVLFPQPLSQLGDLGSGVTVDTLQDVHKVSG
jgi:hypothetical protein